MTKKKKSGRTQPREWGEWSIGEYPNKEKPDYLSEEQWQEALRWREETTCYVNEIFQVNIKDVTDNANNVWKWLSIKRRDKKAIHDWRALQRIKNDLVGEEFEAIEIYPSESQLVDEANQYHLWVMPEGQVAPVGFRYGRTTCTPEEAALVGGRQRAFTD
jgi:hypothetical protein